MIHGHDPRKTAEDLTVPPPWVPFQTNIVYRLFEARRIMAYPTAAVEGLSFGWLGFSGGGGGGLEISRNERDGLFTSASVAETIRQVVVEEEGKIYRNNAASQQKKIFGNKRLQDHYADGFIEFLKNPRAGVYSK
ncbi:unnamed protein product [Arabidopsis halleri]